MVLYGMIHFLWFSMVWYGIVWYGMVWYGMVWYVMVRVVFQFSISSIHLKFSKLFVRFDPEVFIGQILDSSQPFNIFRLSRSYDRATVYVAGYQWYRVL